MEKELIRKAIKFATTNEVALSTSARAGCYYCMEIYDASEVTQFLRKERTALCPKCGIDSVIPSNSPIDLTPENMKLLNKHWF